MKRINLKTCAAALAAVAALAATPQAKADFISVDNEPDGEIKLFLAVAVHDATDAVGTINGDNVAIHTSDVADFASGFATITPGGNGPGSVHTITYTPADPTLFNDFCFRGQLNTAGDVKVTITDQHDSVFTFTEPKSADFGPLCFIGINGETIKSVKLEGDFKEQKQTEFSYAVPEPTTMIAGALLLLPFGASTLRVMRNRKA